MKSSTFIVAGLAIATGTTLVHLTSLAQNAHINGLPGLNVSSLVHVASANGLKPTALKAALNAYSWAYQHHKLGANKSTLTVVDFTLPSYQKRLWVLDLVHDKVLLNTYTAQGKNSGLVYATHFSNSPRTDESSLGLFTTDGEYYGEHAESMHLRGLEAGINDNAYSRALEIHAASYVSPAFIKAHHRAGRSWGCFAVNPAVKNKLLNYLKGGSALFAYATAENHDPIVEHGPLA